MRKSNSFPKSIEKYRQKYNYLHFGVVQIAAKPFYREGLDTSLLLYLRDICFLNFNDSLLGMVETVTPHVNIHKIAGMSPCLGCPD
jgi:hypothetical protein